MIDWWAKKYNLPPNHELLLRRSPASLLREMFDDLVAKRDELTELVDDKNYDQRVVVENLTRINKILGVLDDPKTLRADPVAEEWEAAVISGKPMPASFTEGLPKPRKNKQNG